MSFITVFIASLLGSLHCAGMCGGFVAYFAGRSETPFTSHLAYHFGRLSTYVLLGAVAGILGRTLDSFAALVGFQRLTAVFAGILLIYWGLRAVIGGATFQFESTSTKPRGIARVVQPVFRLALEKTSRVSWNHRAGLLGIVSTFLPCGWLYSFTAVAAASADPLQGALVMAAFWLGTVPILASFGGFSRMIGAGVRAYAPRIAGALLIVAGLFSLFSRHELLLGVPTDKHHHHTVHLEEI